MLFTIFCSTDLGKKGQNIVYYKKTNNKVKYLQDKDTFRWVASCWYLTLYPEANYATYHILCAFEAAGCTLPSLNTDFRTSQCRYFFQVGMNLSIERRQGMPHALVERCNAQKSLCSCSSPSAHTDLSESLIHAKTRNKSCCTKVTESKGEEFLSWLILVVSYLSGDQ